MRRQVTYVIGVLGIVLLVVTACSAGATPTEVLQPAPDATQPVGAGEQAEPVEMEEPDPTAVDEGSTESVQESAAGEPAAETGASGPHTFSIIADESEARFIVDEVLNGNPKTVIGVTNVIEGTITADYANPGAASVSTIRVDLSGLKTDNDFRNRAVHEAILQTGRPEFQYAEFNATALSGLPDTVTVGESFDFQIRGDLTIHGVTREVTFDATVTPVSETRLEGVASLAVLYADFDVNILRLPPQVASVEDSVILEFEFVAEATT